MHLFPYHIFGHVLYNDPNMETQIQIRDLGEAATLMSIGHPLVSVQPSPDSRYKIFVFQSDAGIGPILARYRTREVQVDAYTFYRHMKDLKDQVNAGRPR